MSNLKQLNVRLPQQTHDDLMFIAQIDGKSMSSYLAEYAEQLVRERMTDPDFIAKLTENARKQQAMIARAAPKSKKAGAA